jgi:type VI secretion system protein ImpG
VDRSRPLDFEVFSVQRVRGLGESADSETEFRPFYGRMVRDAASGLHRAYYTLRREPRLPSSRQRRQGARSSYAGSEVFVALADEREAPYQENLRQLAIEVLATNRDLPLLLVSGMSTMLMFDGGQPVERVEVLAGPTRPRASLPEGEHAWLLISHLTLHYQGLFSDAGSGNDAASALRELLLLYGDPAQPAQRRQVEGIVSAAARSIVTRLPMPGPIVYGRGLDIELRVSEASFDGAGAYLLGTVLEKFLARHASVNSFTRTRLVSEERGEIARWPGRAGTRVVV